MVLSSILDSISFKVLGFYLIGFCKVVRLYCCGRLVLRAIAHIHISAVHVAPGCAGGVMHSCSFNEKKFGLVTIDAENIQHIGEACYSFL